jgi:hypothetical protein
VCQIFGIYQKHSYSRLYISYELFERLISAYSIFPRIWDYVLRFRFQVRESDVGSVPLKYRQLESALSGTPNSGSFGKYLFLVLLVRLAKIVQNVPTVFAMLF